MTRQDKIWNNKIDICNFSYENERKFCIKRFTEYATNTKLRIRIFSEWYDCKTLTVLLIIDREVAKSEIIRNSHVQMTTKYKIDSPDKQQYSKMATHKKERHRVSQTCILHLKNLVWQILLGIRSEKEYNLNVKLKKSVSLFRYRATQLQSIESFYGRIPHPNRKHIDGNTHIVPINALYLICLGRFIEQSIQLDFETDQLMWRKEKYKIPLKHLSVHVYIKPCQEEASNVVRNFSTAAILQL